MNESDRQKIERQYRAYRKAVDPIGTIPIRPRAFVQFLAWLESKAGYEVRPVPPVPAVVEEAKQ